MLKSVVESASASADDEHITLTERYVFSVGENVYGKSITDPCLGWDKTEKLIYEIADSL